MVDLEGGSTVPATGQGGSIMLVTGSGVGIRLWTLSDLMIAYTITETESVFYII